MADKPKRRLLAIRLPDETGEDVIRARRMMWVGWLDECAAVQDAFVEGMLANLPSRDALDG